jgi:hypothetical protein
MKILYFSRNYSPHDQRFLTALSKTEHQVGYLRLEGRHPQSTVPALPDGIQPIAWAAGVKPFRISDIPRLRTSLEKVIYQHKPDLLLDYRFDRISPLGKYLLGIGLAGIC